MLPAAQTLEDPDVQASICRKVIKKIEVSVKGITIQYHVGENHYGVEFDQESVPYRLDYPPSVPSKNRSQQLPLFSYQSKRKCFILLSQRGVAYHVGKHYRRQLAVFPGQALRFFPFLNDKSIVETLASYFEQIYLVANSGE